MHLLVNSFQRGVYQTPRGGASRHHVILSFIARVTGNGTDFTYHWHFNKIYVAGSAQGQTSLLSQCGWVSVSGHSFCQKSPGWNYESAYNFQAYFDYDVQFPALMMGLRRDENSRRLFYHFWTGYCRDHYPINFKTWGVGHPLKEHSDTVEWPQINIGVGDKTGTTERFIHADVQKGYQYLEEITDQGDHSVSIDDPCIQGHQVYHSFINRSCPVNVDLKWFFDLRDEEIDMDVEVDEGRLGWRPEKDKNPASIMARINKPRGMMGTFKFSLYDYSSEPGHCLNAGDDEEDDLEFVFDEDIFNPPYTVLTEDGQKVQVIESKSPMEYCGVQILPHDYGAYGKLKVEVEFCGQWHPAHVKGGSKEYVDIPRDDNGNHIADKTVWDKNGAPADSDEDQNPMGDASKGDGLSLYEEYRGFEMKGKWAPTHPDTKDPFVCFDCSLLTPGSFEQATGLSLHEIDHQEFQGRDKRVVNFNNKTAHLVDQHGIFIELGDIVGDDNKKVEADGVTRSFRSPIRSPGDVLKVMISYSAVDKGRTVAHELGHCVSLLHHGDGNRYITKWEVEHSLNPSAEVLKAMEYIGDEDRYYLAVWQGENSGNSECFMRYDSANLYQRNDGHIYIYPIDEKGDLLCDSNEGTGYNDRHYVEKVIKTERYGKPYEFQQVYPMCGDAVRGACKYQIHVSDKRD